MTDTQTQHDHTQPGLPSAAAVAAHAERWEFAPGEGLWLYPNSQNGPEIVRLVVDTARDMNRIYCPNWGHYLTVKGFVNTACWTPCTPAGVPVAAVAAMELVKEVEADPESLCRAKVGWQRVVWEGDSWCVDGGVSRNYPSLTEAMQSLDKEQP